jgi:hypothetical protein
LQLVDRSVKLLYEVFAGRHAGEAIAAVHIVGDGVGFDVDQAVFVSGADYLIARHLDFIVFQGFGERLCGNVVVTEGLSAFSDLSTD